MGPHVHTHTQTCTRTHTRMLARIHACSYVFIQASAGAASSWTALFRLAPCLQCLEQAWRPRLGHGWALQAIISLTPINARTSALWMPEPRAVTHTLNHPGEAGGFYQIKLVEILAGSSTFLRPLSNGDVFVDGDNRHVPALLMAGGESPMVHS